MTLLALPGGLPFGAEAFGGALVRSPAAPPPPALSLREGLYARLRAHGTIAALVGARIRPGPMLPQGEPTPAVTYEVLLDRKVRILAGATGYREARVQIGCWGSSIAQCVALAEAVDSLLESLCAGGMDCDLGGVVVRWVRHDEEDEETLPLQDGSAKNRWILPIVYLINYRES